METVALQVNGVRCEAQVEPRTLLVELIRDHLGLTGTKVGCDTSQCGACTIHLDGKAVKSCTVLAVQADGSSVTTIEGLTHNGALHPIQEAFWAKHGLQCGYCTPGIIMSACAFLKEHPAPTDGEIREMLAGHLCRCTGYHFIVEAIAEAARALSGSGPAVSSK